MTPILSSSCLADILKEFPQPKRPRPRPLSRSLVVAWKHVSANLRFQDTHAEDTEFVSSNFILVESAPFAIPPNSLPIQHHNYSNDDKRIFSHSSPFDRPKSFLEF